MRRTTTLLVLTACVSPLAWAACSSDTFTSGDAGADANDDVPGIVGGGDSSTGDASLDAPKDGPAIVTHFCTGVDAAFCSDFDEPDATAPWMGGIITTGTWTAKIETAQSSSKPNGFEIDTVGQEAGSALITTILGNPADAGATISAVLDFDMIIPTLNGAFPPFMLFDFGCLLGGPTTHYGLAYGAGQWNLSSQQAGPLAALTGTVPLGAWTHVTMSIELSTTGSVSINIGAGAALATATGVNTTGGPNAFYPIQMDLGTGSANNTYTTSIFFDNVVVHLQ